MDGLVDAVAPTLAVGNTAETRAGQETNAAGDDTRLVGDDVTEEVAREDDAVERARALDHHHGRRIDELVLDLELGELLLKHLGRDLSPQPARRQHVGLVKTPHRLVATRNGEETRKTRHTLNLWPAVGFRVHGLAIAVVLDAVAEVNATGQLTNHDKVGAAADLSLERGEVDEGVGGEVARAQIAVGTHLFAEAEEALFRADGAGAPFGAADGAEEHGRSCVGGREGLVGKGGAGSVNGGLSFFFSVRNSAYGL